MVFNASVVLTWILYLALFPMAFFWLRRAWRIVVRRDYSEVALKRGESPARPESFAPYAAVINAAAGCVAVFVVIGVALALLSYEQWTAIAGVTIWFKFFADFILSRHAHPFSFKKKG